MIQNKGILGILVPVVHNHRAWTVKHTGFSNDHFALRTFSSERLKRGLKSQKMHVAKQYNIFLTNQNFNPCGQKQIKRLPNHKDPMIICPSG